MDETEALAVLLTCLKRKDRRVDPIYLAKCAEFLATQYGSVKKVAQTIKVRPGTIDVWVKLARVPHEFQQYISDKQIYPVAAYRIACAFQSEAEQLEVARRVVGWPENEILMLIRCKKENPEMSIDECKEKIIAKGIRQLFKS